MRVEQEHGYYTTDSSDRFHSENNEPAIVIYDYVEKDENDEDINIEGYMAWYTNGILHRENDLPAVIRNGGKKFWYENGNYIREE